MDGGDLEASLVVLAYMACYVIIPSPPTQTQHTEQHTQAA